MIYDSWFDNYLGALALFEFMMEVSKKSNFKNDEYKSWASSFKFDVSSSTKREDTLEIKTGEIGIVVLGLKTLDGIAVGDTMTDAKIQQRDYWWFWTCKPFVFAGLYPIETDKFEDLRGFK